MEGEGDKEVGVESTSDSVKTSGAGMEKVVFPPAPSWYRTNAAAARDDMWAYLAGQMIVCVKPKLIHTRITGTKTTSEGGGGGGDDLSQDKKLLEDPKIKWPSFNVFGYQREQYVCLSFCQSGWDFLPVKCSPLITGCKEGVIRIWNVVTNECVMYHTVHKQDKNVSIVCIDWSIRNPHVIYSMDEEGTLVSWHLKKLKLKETSFGKISPSSLQSSPHEDNIIAFGSKGGTIFIAEADPSGKASAKILHKVRHDEEVVATLWCPRLDWCVNRAEAKTTGPVLASSVQSTKSPTIRFWSQKAEDRGMYQVWEKDKNVYGKVFRNFSPLFWATDPNSGLPLLLTASRNGQILSYSGDTISSELVHDIHNHSSIFGLVQCGDVLWSTSYEPVIVGWNLRTGTVACVIPCFKGVCAIAQSPSVGSLLTIGGCDANIRVINFEENYPQKKCFKAPMLSQRLRSKIMALAWHPQKDNLLGFGTDDGVLGIYEVRENQKVTTQFDRRVGGTVYSVDWGPTVHDSGLVPSAPDEVASFSLFVCGGNRVYQIHPSKTTNALVNVSKLIELANQHNQIAPSSHTIASKATDIRWSPDYTVFAVGYNDGRVELYTPPFLQLKCWIKCHARAIQYLSWRQYDFQQKLVDPDHKHRWFASSANDGTTRLFNLENIFDDKFLSDNSVGPKLLISSAVTLRSPGGERIISSAWSPHDPNLIVTVSYDSTGIVWNINDSSGSPIARYFGHQQRLVACAFHPKNKFQVITGSDECLYDSTVHVWDYRDHPYQDSRPAGHKKSESDPVHIKSKQQTDHDDDVIPESEGPSVKTTTKNASSHVHICDKNATRSLGPYKEPGNKKSRNKNAKSRSLLSSTANMFINSKLSLESEIQYLVKGNESTTTSASEVSNGHATPAAEVPLEQSEADEDEDDDKEEDKSMLHLGLLGDFEQCVDLMRVECESHIEKEDWEKAGMLASWMGDSDLMEKVVRQGQISESIVHYAKSLSKPLYVAACEAFAEKLIHDDDVCKAVTYLLLAGKREKAVQTLLDHRLFREAVVLVKTQKSKMKDISLETVMQKWLRQVVQDGNLEVAAKVYSSMGLYQDALAVIEKRDTPYARKTGMYLASKSKDVKKLEMFGLNYCIECMMKAEYEDAKAAISNYAELKWLLPFILAHEAVFHLSNRIRDVENASVADKSSVTVSNIKESISKVIDLDAVKTEGVVDKLKQTVLVSVAQNSTDADVILTRTLVQMIVGDEEIKASNVEDILKLSDTWFATKAPYKHSAYVMAFDNLARFFN